MKKIQKIVSMLLFAVMLIGMMGVTSFAEDVNPFPPVRPSVGNMCVGVSDNSGTTVVGLRTNGTLVVNSPNVSEKLKNEIYSLNNIVDVDCTTYSILALRSDGTVYKNKNTDFFISYESDIDVSSWTDIVSVECGSEHVVGLKADGTVVATGENGEGQCNVMGWNNVSKIYAHDNTTLAIKKDGTVLATGSIRNFSELRKLKNVKDLFEKGYEEYGALLSDGTITSTERIAIVGDRYAVQGEEGAEYVDLSLDAMIKMGGHSKRIVSFTEDHSLSGTGIYYFLDEAGDMYKLEVEYLRATLEKIEENIKCFEVYNSAYYALDENGQIWSNVSAFTSDDWILTTNITYDGKKIDSDVPPYIKDGRTLAPIRAILEALGMIVSWDGATQTATATKGDVTISVTINSNIAFVNGVQKTLDVPAEITNSRTFVPVRFFAEALDMNVGWDGYTKTVIIESK